MTDTYADPLDAVRAATPIEGEPDHMLPAEAYTSAEVLAWERRHLFAGSWTCLGRLTDLFPETGAAVRQRAAVLGDVPVLLVRDSGELRMFANTCRHRGHELLGEGETSPRSRIVCPYHAWSYDLEGALRAARGFQEVDGLRRRGPLAGRAARRRSGRAGCSGTPCIR